MLRKKYSKYFILYLIGLILTSILIIICVTFSWIKTNNSTNPNNKENQNMEHNENHDIVDVDNIQEYS